MIIPYESLLQLEAATLNNLIHEYLLSQVESGQFCELSQDKLDTMTDKCKLALKRQELLVVYSEQHESIGIKHKDEVLFTDDNFDLTAYE